MILDVRIDSVDAPIGKLERTASSSLVFQYTLDYASRENAAPISLALPVSTEPFSDNRTRAYFANLLPENEQLERVMAREGIERDDVVGLLYHLGADCPGAISCLPESAPPVKVPGLLATDYNFLSGDEIYEIARRLADREPLPENMNDPSPVAGVQRKIALVAAPDGRFALPKEGLGAPTTHILKMPRRAEAREADLEAAAARLAKRCGLDVSIPEVVNFRDVKGLLITRFDRTFSADGVITRIHQEDFAQALALAPSLKYERDGGPGGIYDIDGIVSIFDQCAAPALARNQFLQATLFNIAIGNNDNHAKNHGLLYDHGDTPRLAPLYDLLPTKLNPQVTHQMAFHIGNAEFASDLKIQDFAILFKKFGFTKAASDRFRTGKLIELMEALDNATDEEADGMKDFADLIGTEMHALADVMRLEIKLSERDYYTASAGGWASS